MRKNSHAIGLINVQGCQTPTKVYAPVSLPCIVQSTLLIQRHCARSDFHHCIAWTYFQHEWKAITQSAARSPQPAAVDAAAIPLPSRVAIATKQELYNTAMLLAYFSP